MIATVRYKADAILRSNIKKKNPKGNKTILWDFFFR